MKKTIHSLFRTLHKSLPAWLLVVLTAAVISQAFAGTAYAASLTVAIKQVKPDSTVQTVTCTLLQKNCDLPFVINAGTPAQQSLNIHVVYFNGGLSLNFKTSGGYFYTANKIGNTVVYSPLWNERFQGSAPATFAATLFQPLASDPVRPNALDAAHTLVASLEITTKPGP